MFSDIPEATFINESDFFNSMIYAKKIIHSVITDTSYQSYGECRQNEKHCIFHYTIRGHGEVIYKNKSYFTNPGEGFFNIINEKTSGYRYPKGYTDEWEFIVICFDGANVRETAARLLENKVVYKIKNETHFKMMCKKLVERIDSDMYVSFFPHLMSLIFEADRETSKLCNDFENIVKRDVLENPLISAIADEMHISREHLSREYSRLKNITPAKYIDIIRFEKLCELLSTPLSMQEIADMMRFPSVSGLSIFFKKQAGISPNAFRKNNSLIV